MAKELKERLINYVNYYRYEESDDEQLLLDLYNFIQEEIRYNHPLINYGINELDGMIDYIEEEIEDGNIQDGYDLTHAIFEGACINGTLTFSTLQAQMEVNAYYDLDEIQEIQNDYQLEYCESLHVVLCMREFESYFEEKLEEQKDENPELEEQELLIKTCHSILEEN